MVLLNTLTYISRIWCFEPEDGEVDVVHVSEDPQIYF